jgi:hypothetical protein
MEKVNETRWRKSSRCAAGSCVEVAKVAGEYLIRDSKDPAGTVLSFTEEEWAAFLAGVAAGEFAF